MIPKLKKPDGPSVIFSNGTEKELSLDEDYIASNACMWKKDGKVCGRPAKGFFLRHGMIEYPKEWYCDGHLSLVRAATKLMHRKESWF